MPTLAVWTPAASVWSQFGDTDFIGASLANWYTTPVKYLIEEGYEVVAFSESSNEDSLQTRTQQTNNKQWPMLAKKVKQQRFRNAIHSLSSF